MRILFRTPHFGVSGGVKSILTISNGLMKRGFNVSLMPDNQNGSLGWLPFTNHVPIIPKNSMCSNFDLVFSYGDEPECKHLSNIPSILFLQGYGTQSRSAEERNLKKKHKAVVCVSEWLCKVANKYGHTNVVKVPIGVDFPFFNTTKRLVKTDQITRVGCLYHPAKLKNFDLFHSVMLSLTKEINGLEGVLLSASGVPSGYLNKGVKYNIFCRPKAHDTPLVYCKCDVWASVSTNEGFGLPYFEAMACYVPVVLHPNRGCDEYAKSGENCIIANTRGGFVDGIKLLMSDFSKRDTIIDNGRSLSEKFVWSRCLDRFVDLLRVV